MILERAMYNLLLPIASAAARIAALFNDKIAKGLEGRKGFEKRWPPTARHLDGSGPTVWFHVSSVGEFEQAKPVMDLLMEHMEAGLNIALTFYSPSGMNYYRRFDRSKRNAAIKFVDYLPIDTIRNARFCLDTLGPDMLVYVKFDLWPNLISEAAARGIPQILVSGTLAPSSKRLSWGTRRFYGRLYSKLTAIAAISDEDAARFAGDSSGDVEIITAGDTRYDQVCRRIDTSVTKLPDLLTTDTRPFIIAGSTWPSDESVVIPGFKGILGLHPDTGLVLAPHEPTDERLEEIKRALERESLSFQLLSKLEGATDLSEPVVVADGVGYLAELYKTGIIAYVGGSFTTGVHNVMEPAVLGLPVLFGPRIDNSHEARKLIELEAGKILHTAHDFEREVDRWLSDRALLKAQGEICAQFIRNHCGAALHCVDLIEKYLNVNIQPGREH